MGFPSWTLAQMADFCQAQNVPYVEIRVLENSVDLLNLPIFATPQRIDQARRMLTAAGVEVLALNSGFHLQDDLTAQATEIARFAALAQELEARCVRFFSGGQPQERPDVQRLAFGWRLVEKVMRPFSVLPVLETHDSLVHSEDILALNQQVDGRLNILWDFAHTTNHGGEHWRDTWAQIGSLVRYLHVKDTVRSVPEAQHPDQPAAPQIRNVRLGEGQLDLPALLRFFAHQPTPMICSLEWEKMWDPSLAPGEEAAHTFLSLIQQARKN